MNKGKSQIVIYWDASAILSTLIKDAHSEESQKWAHQKGAHLFSSLAYAEVIAVISRMQREKIMADVLVEAVIETLENGP
jgi:predicted nucleic acid-binding protein